ncbi:D-alanyl-lipoteichoic acid biosynthesis protein DltD [Clostridium saccharoperbutylacetonicum]|uniref:D-alanyl-lipoteichoic acid biosynthesis protein DltD n=1 Tax=Clostridium saccharoperbutylacetonicum TaxID=36745 RepID=UPI0039E893D1
MKKKILWILMPIFVGIVTVIFLNNFLDKKIQTLLNTKNLKSINIEYGSTYKDRGVIYNEYLIQNNYLLLEGSSELGAPVSQLPVNTFPAKGLENFATTGRAYSQDLKQISVLGGMDSDKKDRKVAMILSLQWFMGSAGIDNTSFEANFSPSQFYTLLSNKNITEEHRKKYASRVDQVLTKTSQFAPEKLYAKIYSNDGIQYKLLKCLFEPYFFARENIVTLKDKGLLYRKLITLPEKETAELREINWPEEYKKAEEQGKSQVTDNEFMVYDTYYDKYLKDNLQSQKDINKNIDLMNSKEYEDYELYLDICSDLNIKPYIILAPTNGRWYDYTGMTKESRDKFFDRIEEMARERGFEVLNLKNEEYTPYFICDVMHLGWKGWTKVNEELYEHFKN